MPLGKLSKKQIQEAFRVLTKLQDTIQSANGVDEAMIIGCTNQFFTLIPHDFGIDNPPLLNDLETIKVSIVHPNFQFIFLYYQVRLLTFLIIVVKKNRCQQLK